MLPSASNGTDFEVVNSRHRLGPGDVSVITCACVVSYQTVRGSTSDLLLMLTSHQLVVSQVRFLPHCVSEHGDHSISVCRWSR